MSLREMIQAGHRRYHEGIAKRCVLLPALGDLPAWQFVLQPWLNTINDELVILVTPRVLDDNQGGVFGYGYQLATKLMQSGS